MEKREREIKYMGRTWKELEEVGTDAGLCVSWWRAYVQMGDQNEDEK